MEDTVVDLGDGAPGMTMNEFMFGSDDPAAQRFPGPVYEEGQPPPGSETAYMSPGYQQDTFGAMPMDIYEMPGTTLAEPTTSYDNPARALRVMQGLTRDGDTELERQRLFNRRVNRQLRENIAEGMENPLENVFGFAGPQIAMEEGGIAELPMEKPKGRGIEGLLMYEGMADPQYPLRPIQKQNFSKKRGFQYGQMVQLDERDEAVGGKLLKQAGIQASVDEVRSNLDPKVMDQMSRILGRDIG